MSRYVTVNPIMVLRFFTFAFVTAWFASGAQEPAYYDRKYIVNVCIMLHEQQSACREKIENIDKDDKDYWINVGKLEAYTEAIMLIKPHFKYP